MKQKIRINIDAIDNIQLDCYQNLKALVLKRLDKNTDILGYCWPWEFVLKDRTVDGFVVSDVEGLENGRFEEYYNVKYIEKEICKEEEWLLEIKDCIDQGLPSIVSFDEFYSFYHYGHVYQKEHGDHAILVYDYNDETRQISFVSAIPVYSGTMSYDLLTEGVLALPRATIIRIEPRNCEDEQSLDLIWNWFVEDMLAIKNNYYKEGVTYSFRKDDKLYAPQFLQILNEFGNLSEQEICTQLSTLLQGTWLWHIDRKAQWTLRTLQNCNYIKKYEAEVQNYFDKVIPKWVIASRILFKFTITHRLNRFDEVKGIMNEIVETDLEFFEIIKNTIKNRNKYHMETVDIINFETRSKDNEY